jgi:hypothetical protein
MKRNRAWIRALLGIMLVAACLAAAIAPALTTVQASVAAVSEAPGDIVISSFRLVGPGGADDDFVEIFNRSCSPVSLEGWVLQDSFGTEYRVVYDQFPATPLGPNQYFLIAGSAYTASTPDVKLATGGVSVDSTDGLGLFRSSSATVPADAVGVGTSVDNFQEGSQITYPGSPPTVPSGITLIRAGYLPTSSWTRTIMRRTSSCRRPPRTLRCRVLLVATQRSRSAAVRAWVG